MAKSGLTGSRLRERRLDLGVKQGDLALHVGISSAYLNLIEHNRRRIGGKLLVALAAALDVEPSALTQGAEQALLSGLTRAASDSPDIAVEADSSEQLLSRFPGWAALILNQSTALHDRDNRIAAMTDRLAHDPFLGESLHDVLTAVTAIRSSASILAQTPDIDPDWQRRFQTNVFEDSTRLAATAQSLVSYFETMARDDATSVAPASVAEQYFSRHGFHFPELEAGGEVADLTALADFPGGQAGALAENWLQSYARDCRAVGLEALTNAIATNGLNPAHVAQTLGLPVGLVLRRLATIPATAGIADVGLIRCDIAGSTLFRKPIDGFALPLIGAACPLWPLYQALAQPGLPLARVVQTPSGGRFHCFAVAEVALQQDFDGPLIVTATMAMMKTADAVPQALPIGPTCQICPRSDCAARRPGASG